MRQHPAKEKPLAGLDARLSIQLHRAGGDDQSIAVAGLKTLLRTNRDDLVAIQYLPGFGALHEGLMRNGFLGRFGRSMHLDIVRARDELPMDRSDASCDQVGVLKIANPYNPL